MSDGEDLEKLKDARDKVAEVFEAQVKDEVHDNGALDMMTKAITNLENVIKIVKDREA